MEPGDSATSAILSEASDSAALVAEVETQTLELLRRHPGGLGEYELLKALQSQHCAGFPLASLSEPLPLFRQHFLLYHCLYRLRDHLWQHALGHLDIQVLNIRLQPYRPAASGLSQADPLRGYYLDLSHLHRTSENQVRHLLGQFWQRLHDGDRRQAALRVLGLSDPVDQAAIKRQYRSLAMLYHPDRGGDGELFRAINQARQILGL